MIGELLDSLAASNGDGNSIVEQAVGTRVLAMCARFPHLCRAAFRPGLTGHALSVLRA